MSASLHPATLERFGLAAALREHAGRLEEQQPGLQFELELPRGELPLDERERLAFYRIGQEAMTDAAAHAGVEQITVRLEVEDEQLQPCIRDRGKGFQPQAEHPEWYGLLGMKERADAIGANLQIQSAPGAGTTVTAKLVLHAASA